MILTKEQLQDMQKVVEPVMEWLSKNCHPHVKIVIGSGSAEVVEGVATYKTDKYILD